MKMHSFLKSKFSKIKKESISDELRYEIYPILTAMLISKEIFKFNRDTRTFIESMNIEFREYIFGNRALLVGKILMEVQKADDHELRRYCEAIGLFISNLNDDFASYKSEGTVRDEMKKDKENYMKTLLDKYSRNKD